MSAVTWWTYTSSRDTKLHTRRGRRRFEYVSSFAKSRTYVLGGERNVNVWFSCTSIHTDAHRRIP